VNAAAKERRQLPSKRKRERMQTGSSKGERKRRNKCKKKGKSSMAKLYTAPRRREIYEPRRGREEGWEEGSGRGGEKGKSHQKT